MYRFKLAHTIIGFLLTEVTSVTHVHMFRRFVDHQTVFLHKIGNDHLEGELRGGE